MVVIKVLFPVKIWLNMNQQEPFLLRHFIFETFRVKILGVSSVSNYQKLGLLQCRTMAITTSFLRLNSPVPRPSLYDSQGRVFLVRRCWFRVQPRTIPIGTSIIKAEAGVQKEDIVIVGAGIAGLATVVSLRRKLADAIKSGPASVEAALRAYGGERWSRVFPLTIRANIVGSLLQWDNPLVCSVRNIVVIPKLVRLGPVLEHKF